MRLGLRGMLAATLMFSAMPALAAGLEVKDAWSRATPPGSQVGAGFALIANSTASSDRLTSVASDVSERAEIHEMKTVDGMMKMAPLPALDIPAGQTVELKPGSYHIMFIGLKKPLKEGETIKGVLNFEKAGAIPVEFAVRPVGAGAHSHM